MKQRLALALIPAVALALYMTIPPQLSASDVRDRAIEDLVARSGSQCQATGHWSIGLPDDLNLAAAGDGPGWIASGSIFRGTADELGREAKARVVGRSESMVAIGRQDDRGRYLELYMVMSVNGHTILVLSETSRAVLCTDG